MKQNGLPGSSQGPVAPQIGVGVLELSTKDAIDKMHPHLYYSSKVENKTVQVK